MSAEPRLLPAVEGAPFAFDVGVETEVRTGSGTFHITGPDPVTATPLRLECVLRERTHNAYLDLFDAVARRFRTRVPRNRQPQPAPAFEAPFQPLLTTNLSPAMRHGYGDPAVIRVDGGEAVDGTWYYLVVTSNDAPDSFPIARSRNLRDWTLVGFVFPRGRKPTWAADGKQVSDYWAPEMHRVGGEYRVYFVAREREGHHLSIGLATAPTPEGPFVTPGEPVLRGDVIDPHLLLDAAGDAFLFWKEDANGVWPSRLSELLHDYPHLISDLFPDLTDRRTASLSATLWPWARTLDPMERFFVQQVLMEAVTSSFTTFQRRFDDRISREADHGIQRRGREVQAVMRTPIRAQRLTPDGRGFVGNPLTVLENDREWEAHLIEGVWVARHEGRYYLFYAGNDFSTADYGIGVAVADTALGPYRKMEQPFLRSTAEWWGPGHPSVATGPDGEPWLFLHAFQPGRTGYNEFRALLTLPIAFERHGVRIREAAL